MDYRPENRPEATPRRGEREHGRGPERSVKNGHRTLSQSDRPMMISARGAQSKYESMDQSATVDHMEHTCVLAINVTVHFTGGDPNWLHTKVE